MIRNVDEFYQALPANFDGLFVWDYINICFPRKIELSDIDGHGEIGGLHLFIETKNPGVKCKDGERLKYRALLEQAANAVLFIEGKTEDAVKRLEFYDGLGPPRIIDPATAKDVQNIVWNWVHHAEWLYEEKRLNGRQLSHPDKWRFNFWE